MDHRSERLTKELRELIAEFFSRTSNRTSLITVTSLTLGRDNKSATVGISVLPAEQEQKALAFLERQYHELREFLQKKIKNSGIPRITIVIDEGEKNRQRIEELSRKEIK